MIFSFDGTPNAESMPEMTKRRLKDEFKRKVLPKGKSSETLVVFLGFAWVLMVFASCCRMS